MASLIPERKPTKSKRSKAPIVPTAVRKLRKDLKYILESTYAGDNIKEDLYIMGRIDLLSWDRAMLPVGYVFSFEDNYYRITKHEHRMMLLEEVHFHE